MKHSNVTRNALFTSIISLLLCVSMLVGTTFAWFTDEVVSGTNIIAAGNLDIELLAGGQPVNETTPLFDDVILWEPGAVVYETLQVANVGSLALQYQMTLNIADENNLNGHKLSEVLKFAVVDAADIPANATRAEVLALAKAAVAEDNGKGTLSNLYLTGELLAGESANAQTVVIFWEPTDRDNDYNANNGQKTSDGQPLYIKFGIKLQATQLMHEYDSFGNDYDGQANIVPMATVNDLGPKTILATLFDGSFNSTPSEYAAPFILQLLPNEQLTDPDGIPESYDEYLDSPNALWHVDFVVKADRDVAVDSLALIGYYNEWCQYNDDYWVAMIAPETIPAGTEIRLVSSIATVNYEEICRYGNDPLDELVADLEGFLCTAVDLDGSNAGTTVTVELRMYETPVQGGCAEGGGCKHPYVECETGVSYVVGTYSYTFGEATQDTVIVVNDAAELQAALNAAQDGAIINFGADITGNVVAAQKSGVNVTINGNGHKFNGVMTVFGNGNQAGAEALRIKNINFVAAEGAASCIVSPDRSVNNKYSYAHNVTIEGCTFTDPDGAVNCAAIRHEDGGDKNWTVKACSADSTMHSLLQVQNVEGELLVENCVVNTKNGINLNSCTDVTVSNCEFNVKGYAIRFGVGSGGDPAAAKNFVVADSVLKSECNDGDAVIIFRASAVNAILNLNNTTIEGTTEISGATTATTIVRN